MFKLYKKYLKTYKKHIIIGPLCKLVEAIFELLVPLVIANIINKGLKEDFSTKNEQIMFILKNGGMLLAFAVVGLSSTLVCQYMASKASQGFGTDLRNDLYSHINTLSFKELDEFNSSSLLTRMNNDINNVQQSVAMLIRLVIRAPFLVVGATVLSFFVDIKAGFIFLVTGILLFLFIFLIMYFIIPNNKKSQKTLDELTTITKENLTGNRVVRAFNKKNQEFRRFVDTNVDLKKLLVRVGNINALLNPMSFIITNIAIIMVLFIVGKEFSIGGLNQGEITSLYNYLLQIQIAIMVVANLVVIFTKASVSSSRINEVFNTKSSIVYGSLEEGNLKEAAIEFENASFSYNNSETNALDKISFKINHGESVGIIGSTGAGKTTLINLINRFYDTNSGAVKLFGNDIKLYKKSFITKNISNVMQKAILFSGTIKENLLWGNENASEEELNLALKNACALDFVSTNPEGLDYKILQGGKNLSGGQRQRLSIARSLVSNAPILILDDSYSALDLKTESFLRKNISSLNKTTITISQRASSIKDMDKIIVIDNGKIVGLGKHEELFRTCNVYKEICDSQDIGGNTNE